MIESLYTFFKVNGCTKLHISYINVGLLIIKIKDDHFNHFNLFPIIIKIIK